MHARKLYLEVSSSSVCSPKYMMTYFVGAGQDEGKVTVIVNQQHEDADVPLVGEIAECDEEYGEAMMESELEEIAFWTNEAMTKEATEVFSELDYVEHLHLEGGIEKVEGHSKGASFSSEPGGHEGSIDNDYVCPHWAHEIVNAGVSPFY